MSGRSLAATVVGAAAVVHLAPSVTALASVRTRLTPRLAGFGDPGHVALTFDDGPDPASTPEFLEVLRRFEVRATFFVLGCALQRYPELGRAVAAAGHELAVHGWTHRPLWARRTPAIAADLIRTRDLVTELTHTSPRWFRPPYGILTTPALLAARQAGLTPVLWSHWGREWAARSTVPGVLRCLRRGGSPGGGTVLLHDAGANGGWATALGALPELLTGWVRDGLAVGGVSAHRWGTQ